MSGFEAGLLLQPGGGRPADVLVCRGVDLSIYHGAMQYGREFGDRWWVRYALRPVSIAAVFVYVTFLCTLVLQSIFPYPFLFLFFGAVMGSAWFGGSIAAAVSVALSTLLIAFFFVPPYFSFTISASAEPYFISFIVCATVGGAVSAMRRRAEFAVRQARDLLEQRVLERTAELQRSNQELLQSERSLRELTEAIPQQIWRATPEGSVDYCNAQLLQFTGRREPEMCGDRFVEVLHREDQPSFQEAWTAAVESRSGLEGEWRIAGTDAKFRWFLIRAVPQLGDDGAVKCWYGTHIDLEDWKRTELALIESQGQLAHVNRVMSMGEVTASIAHEVNQPLAAIVANAYALLGWLKSGNLAKAESTANRIVQDGVHAGAIVARLRALFRREEDKRAHESINHIILQTARFLRDESIRRNIPLRTRLAEDLPSVKVDRVQIQQAILNLALNGMEAMETTSRSEAKLVIQSRLGPAGNVIVAVTDCGAGIGPELQERIFDPFFTTKAAGLGIGLSICRTIIEAHDGRLWASSHPEGGALLQFTLPTDPER